jgi:hypothetical protein
MVCLVGQAVMSMERYHVCLSIAVCGTLRRLGHASCQRGMPH